MNYISASLKVFYKTDLFPHASICLYLLSLPINIRKLTQIFSVTLSLPCCFLGYLISSAKPETVVQQVKWKNFISLISSQLQDTLHIELGFVPMYLYMWILEDRWLPYRNSAIGQLHKAYVKSVANYADDFKNDQ